MSHPSRRSGRGATSLLTALVGWLAAASCSPGGGGGAPIAPARAVPTIDSFTANPAALPPGGGSARLSWSVTGATSLSLDGGIGPVTGSSHTVGPIATTSYTLTATNADGSSTATLTVTVGGAAGTDPPGGGRYAALIAPVDGETFVGPTVDLRLVGVGRDERNWQPSGPGGDGHGEAASVQFFVDGASVLTVDATDSEYWVFKGFKNGLSLAPGDHTVLVRAYYTANPGPVGQIDSRPVTITVLEPPASDRTIELSGDLTLAQASSWVGTPERRIRVRGNGHRISGSGATAVDWQYVDFHDLGDPSSTSTAGIDVATTGPVTVRHCRFDSSNPVRFSLGGTATADIRGNLFSSNMRQPLGQLPYGDSFPAVQLTGSSTGAKTFAGNNVGAGWVDFQAVNHWTVGGDGDADGNVLVGPRVGIHFDYQGRQGASSSIVVRRNFSDHVYFGGWSQGNNLEGGANPSLLAEHNVLIGSSWTVRGMAGEFRYNLLLMAGEDWMWLDGGADVHHNVFVGGDNNRGGLYDTYGNTGIRIRNNTLDGRGGTGAGDNAIYVTGGETVTSNLFMNLPYTPIKIVGGTLSADYNLFWNSASPAYDDRRAPAHDLHADPQLASPAAHAYEFDEKAIWQRTRSVRDVLAAYRAKYLPGPGSPVLGNGDPAGFGAGSQIGAIGDGTRAEDQFGK